MRLHIRIELRSCIVDFAAASVVVGVRGEQKRRYVRRAVYGIVPFRVGIVNRSEIQNVVAVIGATCRVDRRVPLCISSIIKAFGLKKVGDSGSINKIPILVLDAEVATGDETGVVAH